MNLTGKQTGGDVFIVFIIFKFTACL